MFVPFPDIVPQRCDFRLIHNTVAAPASVLSGLQQVQTRPGAAWAARLEWTDLNDAKRHRLRQFVSAMRGGSAVTHFWDFSNTKAGSVLGADNVANAADWPTNTGTLENTGINDAGRVQTVARESGGFQATRTKADAVRTRLLQVRISNLTNQPYILSFDIGTDTASTVTWTVRESDGGPLIIPLYVVPDGGAHITATFDGPPVNDFVILYFELFNGGAGSILVNNIKATPARTVSSQLTTSSALIADLPASTLSLYKAGDMAEVNGQLVRLRADMHSDPDGIALAQFEPELRATAVSGDTFETHRPGALFRMLEPEISEPARPGIFQSFTLDFVEAIQTPTGTGVFQAATI